MILTLLFIKSNILWELYHHQRFIDCLAKRCCRVSHRNTPKNIKGPQVSLIKCHERLSVQVISVANELLGIVVIRCLLFNTMAVAS